MADKYSKDEMQRRMKGAFDTLKNEFAGLRTGRASPALVDPVRVEAYGNMVPIQQVAPSPPRASNAHNSGLGQATCEGRRQGDP